ncbi:MAG: DUF4957 domain-containing protein [Prevotella sp.]|nr:DUF4957 domain-containing protein [Prevotella sp.]
MKKNHFITLPKLCGFVFLGVSTLFLASCAQDGFDDETFRSDVFGSQLDSPLADNIVVTPSADGKSQTITWPVVQGAGGYLISLYDESNPNEAIVKDSLIDGCSVTLKREEDMVYKFTIRTLGNAEKQNTEAETTTEKLISTFTPTFATIPAGSDLNAYFAENPIPDEALTEMLNYDLVGGADYTLSDVLDFDGHKITLRSNSKVNHAKITYTTDQAGITTTAAMNIKYLDFDCSALPENKGVFAFSKNTTVAAAKDIDNTKWSWAGPVIEEPITIVNSNFENVGGYFFWDNQVTTAVMTLLIDNVVCHLTPAKSIAGGVIWTNKGGHINTLTVSNSTFWESDNSAGDFKYFYQAGMDTSQGMYVSGSDYAKNAKNYVNYLNSTFYHVAWNSGQWGNYNGMQGKAYSYWTMTECIFYDCSTSGSVPRRFLHGRKYADGSENVTFRNNTYMKKDGTFQDINADGGHDYDLSGTTIDEDPMFANPAVGDFHISGATQIARKTGDPRWLPEN